MITSSGSSAGSLPKLPPLLLRPFRPQTRPTLRGDALLRRLTRPGVGKAETALLLWLVEARAPRAGAHHRGATVGRLCDVGISFFREKTSCLENISISISELDVVWKTTERRFEDDRHHSP